MEREEGVLHRMQTSDLTLSMDSAYAEWRPLYDFTSVSLKEAATRYMQTMTKEERMAKFRIEHIDRVLSKDYEIKREQAGLRRVIREKDATGVHMNVIAMERARRWKAYIQRLEAVFEALEGGKTYAEIGKSMQITKQRVHQLVKRIPAVLKKDVTRSS